MIAALQVAADAAPPPAHVRPTSDGAVLDVSRPRAPAGVDTGCRDAALAIARAEYALGKRRAALLGGGIFWDPAWNIMLDVFISDCGTRRLSVTAVCLGSGVPIATATRYVRALMAAGLVSKIADVDDGRRTYVVLTDSGRAAMTSLLISRT